MTQQKTLKHARTFTGIGVHSGRQSTLILHPAAPNTGMVFVNAANPTQRFRVGTLVPEPAPHATVFCHQGWIVSTVEHVMAALAALGVTNVELELAGNEVPILDGSALLFAQALLDDGLQEQHIPAPWLTPRERLHLEDGQGRSITIDPAPTGSTSLTVDYSADFQHPLVGGMTFQGVITQEFFMRELAPARTFGFLEQLPLLRKHNLALGSSLGNTVVLGDETMNDMRLPSECIRHKVLDLLGDVSLLGTQLVGHVRAHKTSHNFNRLVVQHYVQYPDLWQLTA